MLQSQFYVTYQCIRIQHTPRGICDKKIPSIVEITYSDFMFGKELMSEAVSATYYKPTNVALARLYYSCHTLYFFIESANISL